MVKINGKYWGLMSGWRFKKDAKKSAKNIRKKGYHARVILHKPSGDWNVYSYDYPKRR